MNETKTCPHGHSMAATSCPTCNYVGDKILSAAKELANILNKIEEKRKLKDSEDF